MADAPQVPEYRRFFNPILQALKALGGSASIEELEARVASDMHLPENVLAVAHSGEHGGRSEYELHPCLLTPMKRPIRRRSGTTGRGRRDHCGASLTSSRRVQSGWSSTRARPSRRWLGILTWFRTVQQYV